jgi:hypothetical protein
VCVDEGVGKALCDEVKKRAGEIVGEKNNGIGVKRSLVTGLINPDGTRSSYRVNICIL